MNKELILKYKKEFDHWLNGGSCLIKTKVEGSWIEVDKVAWKLKTDNLIIINDEYVKFRKALAEGETIESQVSHGYNSQRYPIKETELKESDWKEDTTGIFVGRPELYRIKPEESELKIGDWVQTKDSDGTLGTPLILTSIDYSNPKGLSYNRFNWIGSATGTKLIKWKPQQGEWVVVEDDITPELYVVFQYKGQEGRNIVPLAFLNTLKDK